MKVLVISAAFPPMHAGEATNTYHLCKHLADRQIDVHVLTSQADVVATDPGVAVHPIMREWSWLEAPRFIAFLQRCAPDAILLLYIGWTYKFHPMVTFAPTIAKQLFWHVPFVTRYESAFLAADPAKTSFMARAFRKVVAQWAGRAGVAYNSGTLLRDSDHVIVLSERHRAMLVEEWPQVRSKTILIPPPANLCVCANKDGAARRRGREKLGVQPDDFVIAFMGYVYPSKGIETLLHAFRIVSQQRPRVKLLFIGGKIDLDMVGWASYTEQMQALSKELGVDGSTIWTGAFKSEEEEASIYLHASDACVLPFVQGVQLNNSSFSSMAAHGLPIIATRGPMLDKQYVHGENVLLCEPGDHTAIAEFIIQLMDNRGLRERLREGALHLSEEWFSWDRAIDRTLETFGVNGPSAFSGHEA